MHMFGRGMIVLSLAIAAASVEAQQPLLQLQGQPFSEGGMTLHLSGAAGQAALVLYGLDPLDPPLVTNKGAFFIGTVYNIVPLGPVPALGRIDVPFLMPQIPPSVAGIHLILQGYVPGALSNPASLPLDQPYLGPLRAVTILPPTPSFGAHFGYQVCAGDLNNDGAVDIATSAAYEDYASFDQAGRVYVFWGPDFAAHTTLSPPAPRKNGFFGISLTAADINADAVVDLIVGETAGSPSFPGVTPNLHVFYGGAVFPLPSSFVLPGPGSGALYSGYTHTVTAGDFTGDGFVDLAVGNNKAPLGGFAEAGQIDIFLGPTFTELLVVPNPEPATDFAFGSWLRTARVNGDGIDDLISLNPGDKLGGQYSAGSAHVIAGGASPAVLTKLECPPPSGPFVPCGAFLSAGDVDGDGVDEVLVADFDDHVYLFQLPQTSPVRTLPKPPGFTTNPFGDSAYGRALGIGDVNADGVTDLLISDMWEGELPGCFPAAEGTVLAALGPYYSTIYRIQDKMQACFDQFGRSISRADLDGDFQVDLVVGADAADTAGLLSSGHVTLLHGGQ